MITSKMIMALILVVGIILSITAFQFTLSRLEKDERDQFENTTLRIADTLSAHLTGYEDLLHALQGVFLASDSVTQEEFSLFIDNMYLASRYPGIYSVTYAARVAGNTKHAFEEKVRKDLALRYSGQAEFKIKPDGARLEYLPLLYLYPSEGLGDVHGFDLMASKVRRMSVDLARDSAWPVASGPYTLASKAGSGRTAISLRLALYRKSAPTINLAQLRDAFIGMLNITIAAEELATLVLQSTGSEYMHLRITDLGFQGRVNSDNPKHGLLFDNKEDFTGQKGSEPMLEHIRTLNFGGRVWQLSFAASPHAFSIPMARSLPWTILLGGLLCTGLLGGLIRMLSTTERRAVALANSMTQDLRKSEARYAESQRMTQELIESLPNPIFFKDTDGHYLGVNKAWEEFFGTLRENFIGKTVHDLYPGNKDVADRLHAMDQELWNKPGRQEYEAPIVTPDGKQHVAIYCKATFTRPDGKVGGLIGTIIDITERKQAEQRYQAIFDNAAVGITRVDLDGILRHANQKFYEMLGYDPGELVGTSVKNITHPEDYGQGAQFRGQIDNSTLKSVSTEKRFIHKKGHAVWARRTISVAHDKEGRPDYLVSVVEDITDRKMTEQRQHLEHAVTRVLAEAESMNEAMPRIIQTICETMDWQCGARWEWVPEKQMLYCRECWSIDVSDIRNFIFHHPGTHHPHQKSRHRTGAGRVFQRTAGLDHGPRARAGICPRPHGSTGRAAWRDRFSLAAGK